jgi:hypothetical protein
MRSTIVLLTMTTLSTVLIGQSPSAYRVTHQDDPDHYHVAGTVQTPLASRNMGLDPTNHRVFVVSAKFGPAPASGRGRAPVLSDSFSLMVIEHETGAR